MARQAIAGVAGIFLALQAAAGTSARAVALGGHGGRSAEAVALRGDERAIAHVLDRMGYGPRPGDVERVRAMGLDRYIDQQLHPERIDDRAADRRLASLTTLRLSSREIAQRYEEPLLAARRARKQEVARSDNHKQEAARADDRARPDDQKMTAPGAPRAMAPEMRQANEVVAELGEAKLLRAVYSERQLQEVLTDFWFNHFNVDARKGPDRFLLTEYERDAIRPHILGRFRDLLGATAKSPAMLFYLDNWMSIDPNGPHADAQRPFRRPFGPFGRGGIMMPPRPLPPRVQPKNAPKGLNENYARELMELHTLGVDGGYTQKDVIEVARAFTGWTIDRPQLGGGFRFDPRRHDEGEKVVLGHRIKAGGGERDGEQVLDILASSPATARHIATELVERFVGDVPPSSLVDRAASRFLSTGGDLREVLRTILTSPQFLSPDGPPKARTPFEFLVAALRATSAEVADGLPLVRAVQRLGMPLYQCQPPTGYKDTADAWLSSGALVGRMNVAVMLAANRLPGVSVQTDDRPEALALRLGGPDFQRK